MYWVMKNCIKNGIGVKIRKTKVRKQIVAWHAGYVSNETAATWQETRSDVIKKQEYKNNNNNRKSTCKRQPLQLRARLMSPTRDVIARRTWPVACACDASSSCHGRVATAPLHWWRQAGACRPPSCKGCCPDSSVCPQFWWQYRIFAAIKTVVNAVVTRCLKYRLQLQYDAHFTCSQLLHML